MDLKIKTHFDSAHSLKSSYKDACQGIHGHCYHLIFTFNGMLGNDDMVEDFNLLKEVIAGVVDKYDHTYLNDFFDNPTAEVVGRSILRDVNALYKEFKFKSGNSILRGKFTSLEIWETEKYGIVVSYGE